MYPLTLCLNNPTLLSEINSCLEILSPNPTLKRFVKKTRDDPRKICDFLSELGVAAYLSGRVNKVEFLQPGKTPDLVVYVDNLMISCEVKRVIDKLDDKPKGEVFEINDITTIRTAFKKSVGKGQYLHGKPHIIYFDCPSVSEGEIIDIFYPKAGLETSTSLEINHQLVHHSIVYNGYFRKMDSSTEYTYSMVSGVAAKFYTGQLTPEISEIVYFPNPNAMIQIQDEIIGKLGFKVSKQFLENYGR
jgi:hypothetical protein